MVAYEFYWFDFARGYELIGILPERRTNPERITQDSIVHWAENIFGKELARRNIYFIEVPLDEHTGRTLRPTRAFIMEN